MEVSKCKSRQLKSKTKPEVKIVHRIILGDASCRFVNSGYLPIDGLSKKQSISIILGGYWPPKPPSPHARTLHRGLESIVSHELDK